jgi:hypothetical protein
MVISVVLRKVDASFFAASIIPRRAGERQIDTPAKKFCGLHEGLYDDSYDENPEQVAATV